MSATEAFPRRSRIAHSSTRMAALLLAVAMLLPPLSAVAGEKDYSLNRIDPVIVQLPKAPTEGSLVGDRAIPYPNNVRDPLEPVNRFLFGFNEGLVEGFIGPLSDAWRWALPTGIRKGIRKFHLNLKWPLHAINSMLQGKWGGARDETYRFGINLTVGFLGFCDPATQKYHIPKSREDFGQTFGHWGAGNWFYLFLPVLGPSSGRDGVAEIPNAAADPASWVSGVGTVLSFNDGTFRIDILRDALRAENDPYLFLRDYPPILRKREVLDYELPEAPSGSTKLEPTIGAIKAELDDPKFKDRASVRKARMSLTGEKMRYNLWLQKGKEPAPIVYILPGAGAHRMSAQSVLLAEMAYKHGYHVVTISNALNWEFMEHAAKISVPGNPGVDSREVYSALNDIHKVLTKKYGERIGKAGLMGFSMGAVHTMFIAASEDERTGEALQFDRYVAVQGPIDLVHAAQAIDSYYLSALEWAPEERAERIQIIMMKVAAIVTKAQEGALPDLTAIPMTEQEQHYAIGTYFRPTLRDMIFVSQQRNDLGVLHSGAGRLSRRERYKEIDTYTYYDYFEKIALPYYRSLAMDNSEMAEFISAASLFSISDRLRDQKKLMIFINADDFLNRPEDVERFAHDVGPERLIQFPRGGHGGNLWVPEVKEAITAPFESLKLPTTPTVPDTDPSPPVDDDEKAFPLVP